MILGGAEATLFDLAGAYSSMAGILNNYLENNSTYFSNEYRTPDVIYNEKTDNGNLTEINQLFSAGPIYHTFEAMTNVIRPIEESGMANILFK